MAILTRDPLLAIAKVVLAFLMGVLAFAAAMLLIGAVAIPFLQADVLAQIAAEAGHPVGAGIIWALSGLLIAVAALIGLVVYFMLLLWRIVATVEQGDPFVPENGARLSMMGWLALAGNVLAFLLGVAARGIAALFELRDEMQFDTEFGFDGGGLMLILTLFILARVFRKGTQMRDELEGTV